MNADACTIPAMFFEQAARLRHKPLFWVKRTNRYHPITWSQAAQTVQALSTWLLNEHVQPGDRILVLSENRPEWGESDLAIQAIGAWTVPIYPSLTDREIVALARDCEPVGGIVSSLEQAQKLRAVRRQVSSLRFVIVIEPVSSLEPGEVSWASAVQEGQTLWSRSTSLLDHRLERLKPEETATIIYTSGTTGDAKGVMLSHRNFLSNASAGLRALPIRSSDLHLSFLPLSHVFERMAGWYLMLMGGASVAYAESMDTIPQNMLDIRPSVMLGVPRFFEKLHARVQEGITKAPANTQRVIHWALSLGRQAGRFRLSGRPIPFGLGVRLAVARWLVFHKFRQRLGGRLRFFVSGSAPLSPAIGEFFYHAEVMILEGYGLTETSPVIAVNRLHALKFGTVGLPLDGVEVRIAEDGEILTRGPHEMQGYYRKPRETDAAIIDGWLHTGDIGHLDPKGYLVITDRKKDLIKTAGGKFVAPQKLENLFVTDPYVAQAFVYGDRERYCVALIVPNFTRLIEHAAAQGWPARSPAELARLPAAHELMWSRIQALQREIASFEQVKAIALLEQEFTQAAGELTPTLKAKRTAIATRYQDMLHRLYHSEATTPQ